jgi:hypothetical protein
MRGSTTQQIPMVSTLTPEQLVPLDHPLRKIKVIVDRRPSTCSRGAC